MLSGGAQLKAQPALIRKINDKVKPRGAVPRNSSEQSELGAIDPFGVAQGRLSIAWAVRVNRPYLAAASTQAGFANSSPISCRNQVARCAGRSYSSISLNMRS